MERETITLLCCLCVYTSNEFSMSKRKENLKRNLIKIFKVYKLYSNDKKIKQDLEKWNEDFE